MAFFATSTCTAGLAATVALPAILRGDRRALGLQPGTGDEGRGAGDDDGEQKENDALAIHDAPLCSPWRHCRASDAATHRPPAAIAGP